MGAEVRAAGQGLAFAISTFNRPQAVVRLVQSIREHFGQAPIYIADQSEPDDGLAGFCASLGAHYIRLPYDCGVSQARNMLVRRIEEPFFVLCDDDFIMRPDTRFDGALAILAAEPQIGVVGGRLWDHHDGEPHHRSWELVMQYDRRNRMLLNIPIQHLRPHAAHLGARRYFHCDAVMNFAVMRRAMFGLGAEWDPRYTCNGEHEDFYLNLRENTRFRVVYLPEMVADHDHLPGLEYNRLRHRSEGWQLFFDKWEIDQLWEAGMGYRCRAYPDNWIPADRAAARFLRTIDGHALPPASRDAGELVLCGSAAPAPAHVYAGFGELAYPDQPATADLVICGAGQLATVPKPQLEGPGAQREDRLALDPRHCRVSVLYRACVVTGSTTAIWIHLAPRVPEKPLPPSFSMSLSFRWRDGSRYLTWDSFPVNVNRSKGPGSSAWWVATLSVPPVDARTTSALSLELWSNDPLAPPIAIAQPALRSDAREPYGANPFLVAGEPLTLPQADPPIAMVERGTGTPAVTNGGRRSDVQKDAAA